MGAFMSSSVGGGDVADSESAVVIAPDFDMGASMSSSVGGGDVADSESAVVIAPDVKGRHDFKINNSRTKGLGNGKCTISKPFNMAGHRWCLWYYPNGNCRESAGWISLFLCLHRSNATGFQASSKFTLLDNDGIQNLLCCGSSDGMKHTYKDRDQGWGYSKFIRRKLLDQVLKDDCFTVRCDITVSKKIPTSEFVTVPPSDMNQHKGRLLSSGVDSDVTFQVGEETFAAHRHVLGGRSSVFMAELLGPMKEANGHIRIEDMEPTVFKALLHFIYMDEFPKMDNGDTFAMAQHLLVAADRYDLQRLKLMCEHKLCGCISTSTVTTTLVLAELHGCKGLKKACFAFLKSPSHLKKIMNDYDFRYLKRSCPSLKNELLANVAR